MKRIKLAKIAVDPDLAGLQTTARSELDKLTEARSACERAVQAAVEDEKKADDDTRACEAALRAIFDDM